MVTVKVTNGTSLVENSKRASYLTRLEAVATTDQLSKLVELAENPKARKKLDTSFGFLKKMIG